jgi:hypothetical protein
MDVREGPARVRGDGFGEERKRLFLAALREGMPVLRACALVGISNRTAYNHRSRDPDFARDWKLARRAAKLPLELVAFERAVDGTEEPVYAYGRLSHVRRRRSDALLARLLEGEHPEKYGRTAGAIAAAKMNRRLKRLARRLKALEARIGSEPVRTVRNAGGVNFVNPAAKPSAPRAPRRNWRLAVARRRSGETESPAFRRQS